MFIFCAAFVSVLAVGASYCAKLFLVGCLWGRGERNAFKEIVLELRRETALSDKIDRFGN